MVKDHVCLMQALWFFARFISGLRVLDTQPAFRAGFGASGAGNTYRKVDGCVCVVCVAGLQKYRLSF